MKTGKGTDSICQKNGGQPAAKRGNCIEKYLITGCAGFIGSNFVYYMLNKYDDILLVNLDKLTYAGNLENLKGVEGDTRHVFVQGDICDSALVEKLFAQYDFRLCDQLCGGKPRGPQHPNPEIFVETNVLGTVNLLQCAKNAWYRDGAWAPGQEISAGVHRRSVRLLGAEGYFTETTPLCPHSPYSSSKASADMFVMAFHDTYGMPVNITRCSNNYGPYQFPEKLIPLMIHNVKNHKSLPVYGDGMNVRDWLYVEDHCKAIDMVAERRPCGRGVQRGRPQRAPEHFHRKDHHCPAARKPADDAINETPHPLCGRQSGS